MKQDENTRKEIVYPLAILGQFRTVLLTAIRVLPQEHKERKLTKRR
jgi:hypothetical protein